MNRGMNELGLFAGAGGGLLASNHLLGWRTVCAVEINEHCQSVLQQRQLDGMLDAFPIWDDIRTFDGNPWRGHVDVISGGFPCQDISSAGGRAGLDGDRSGLWFEMLRVIGEVQPAYVFAENSPNLRTNGLERVLEGLAGLGYDAVWGVLGAWHVGAPHRRNRMWIVAAHPTGAGSENSPSMQKWPAHRTLTAMLATPTASGSDMRNTNRPSALASRAMLPTPTCRAWKSGAASEATHARNSRPLNEVARRQGVTGGVFIALREWMMGWPLSWSSAQPMPTEKMNEWLECFAQRRPQASAQALAEEVVRELPRDNRPSSASQRSKPTEQRSAQLPDAVCPVPSEPAYSGGRLGARSSETVDVQHLRGLVSTEENASIAIMREAGVPGRERAYCSRKALGAVNRVERVRATGNGQVPAVAALAWRTLHTVIQNG